METIISIKPFLAVLVSLLAVIPIVASGKKPNLREGWTFLAGIVKFGLVVSMLGGSWVVSGSFLLIALVVLGFLPVRREKVRRATENL